MPIPVAPLSLQDIQNEFFGSNPISLGEYYRGGTLVNINQPDAGYGLIATSGAITMGSFRNATRYGVINANVVAPLQNQSIVQTVSSAGDTESMQFNFLTNGSITFEADLPQNVLEFIPSNWYAPNLSYAGEFYWIRVQVTAGGSSPVVNTFTGGFNTWLPMNITRTIYFQLLPAGAPGGPPTPPSAGDITWTVSIASDAAGSNIITTGTYRCSASTAVEPGGD